MAEGPISPCLVSMSQAPLLLELFLFLRLLICSSRATPAARSFNLACTVTFDSSAVFSTFSIILVNFMFGANIV